MTITCFLQEFFGGDFGMLWFSTETTNSNTTGFFGKLQAKRLEASGTTRCVCNILLTLPDGLFRQDEVGLFNDENPSGNVVTSDFFGSLILCAILGKS